MTAIDRDAAVIITKLSASDNPRHPTPGRNEYAPGEDNPGKSLPISYNMTGVLLCDITLGTPLQMARDTRNGVEVGGFFRSSPVISIAPVPSHGGETWVIQTANSIYKVQLLDREQQRRGFR